MGYVLRSSRSSLHTLSSHHLTSRTSSLAPNRYNTWDDFRCGGINAENVKKVADAFIKYGLDKVGYEYVGIDDCWAKGRDKTTGVIIEDPKAFPDGMKSLVDYVHSKGLKFGIYTDRGTATCVGRPGSQGHETIDAQTYAKWGVDLVKEDSCSAPTDHNSSFEQYGLMRDALNATGRPIYFALCGWSDWYAPVGKTLGNSWRFGYDVNDWNSAFGNAIQRSAITGPRSLAQYAGPGESTALSAKPVQPMRRMRAVSAVDVLDSLYIAWLALACFDLLPSNALLVLSAILSVVIHPL
jgi:alpha-galactosidase